jgi:phage terminase large subunit-like protein
MLFGYDIIPVLMNVYILVDLSKGSSKKSDRTAIAVIGIDQSGFKYLLDGYRHRMQLSERYERVTELKKKWERTASRCTVR